MVRCPWATGSSPIDQEYHDIEWGVPVHDDIKHFEMLTLEGAQAGLSWSTILKRRQEYRSTFLKFDPQRVARMTDAQLQDILANGTVIRNRLKVYSVRKNAVVFMAIQAEFGSFDAYIWRYVNGKPLANERQRMSDVPARTEISDAISKDLKKRGMSFVGSTIIYAYMQAIGMVNDHITSCFRHSEV
ncbi:MAG: DNA-3-methyladenine glycosylase I [Proteobacteria bacterium]|nr:DNA-3-methyladenine glycosylase I [Pseudomonadota bacterium]